MSQFWPEAVPNGGRAAPIGSGEWMQSNSPFGATAVVEVIVLIQMDTASAHFSSFCTTLLKKSLCKSRSSRSSEGAKSTMQTYLHSFSISLTQNPSHAFSESFSSPVRCEQVSLIILWNL